MGVDASDACRSVDRGDDDVGQHHRPGRARAVARRRCPSVGQLPDAERQKHHASERHHRERNRAGDGTVHRIAFGITVRPGATLTLASCAVVQVNPGLVLTVTGTPAAPAKLVSQGTAARPVLVTSAVAGQPWGMWRGLTAQSTFDLSYTTFENGGRGGFHGTSLSLRGGGRPEVDAIPVLRADHLTIRGSVGTGLVMESAAAFTSNSTDSRRHR